MPQLPKSVNLRLDLTTNFRQWYAGGIVGLALFLVAVSLMRPQTVGVQYECEVIAPSIRDPGRSQLLSAQPTTEEMQNWLMQAMDANHISETKVRVEWSCTNADALLVRVVGEQTTQTRSAANRGAVQLAEQLNSLEHQALQAHQHVLMDRVKSLRQRVSAIENNLTVLVADFREAIQHANAIANEAELLPPTEIAPQANEPQFNVAAAAAPRQVEPTPVANPEWTILQHDLQQAAQQLQALAGRFTPEHPLMQAAQLQVDAIANRLEIVPQFLRRQEEVQAPAQAPPAFQPQEDGPPIARGIMIRRTNWQTAVNQSPNLQPYLDDFQRQSRELEASRSDLTQADEALRNFTAHFVGASGHPATVPHPPTLVSHRRQLPAGILLWAFVGSILAGCLFANYANHLPAAPLRSSEEVLSIVGMPVLSQVTGRRLRLDDESSANGECRHERNLLAAAELTVIVVVTAFLVSYFCDPSFAAVVAADPLVGIAEIWRRG